MISNTNHEQDHTLVNIIYKYKQFQVLNISQNN